MIVQMLKVKAEIAEVANNPQSVLLEALHSAGYSGALGHPLLAPESALNSLDHHKLAEFVHVRFYSGLLLLYLAMWECYFDVSRCCTGIMYLAGRRF
jgi:hypothetical protein